MSRDSVKPDPTAEHSDAPIEIVNPSRYMTATYVISLSIIAVLSLVVHFMLDQVIAEQSETGYLVNISGQQRMLSQRVTMFTLEYLQEGDEEDKRLAKQALSRMRENHTALLEAHHQATEQGLASPLSPAMQALYFSPPANVDAQLTTFEAKVLAALEKPPASAVTNAADRADSFFALAKKPLLEALHSVVEQYENESLAKVDELRFAQSVVLGIIILTILIEAVMIFRPMVNRVSLYAQRLQYEANYDPLSGLHNRRAFYLIANKVFAASKRYDKPMSLALIDIDHFKKINDNYGHDIGDLAIRHVSSLLTESCRSADTVSRFGGEEFLVLLPDTDVAQAVLTAEKLRRVIAESPLSLNGVDLHITISVGVSGISRAHDDIDKQIKSADEALYQAKEEGRDCVRVMAA